MTSSIFLAPHRPTWIDLSGPDAADYLHRISTANIKKLAVGTGTPTCFLNGVGKIQSVFWLWRYDSDHFGLEFSEGNSRLAPLALGWIDRYKFQESFEVADLSQLTQSGQWSAVSIFLEAPSPEKSALEIFPEVQPTQTLATDEEIRLCHHGVSDYGRPWITAWGKTARLNQWLDRRFGELPRLSPNTLENWRIQALTPQVGNEFAPDDALPLEVGLARAVAPNKGCYPGQEVIERIFTYGSPPRRLVRVRALTPEAAAEIQAGIKLVTEATPPQEIGTLSSWCAESGQGLAVIRKLQAQVGIKFQISENLSLAKLEVEAVAPFQTEEL